MVILIQKMEIYEMVDEIHCKRYLIHKFTIWWLNEGLQIIQAHENYNHLKQLIWLLRFDEFYYQYNY